MNQDDECTTHGCTRDTVVEGELTYEDWRKPVQYCEEHRKTAEIAAARDGLTLTLRPKESP